MNNFICKIPKFLTMLFMQSENIDNNNDISHTTNLNEFTRHFHNYDWLCYLDNFINNDDTKRWPSDKANHTYCENAL